MNDPATLFDNVDLLRHQAERITGDPRLAAVTHPSAALSIAYLGDGLVPIGALLRLWAMDAWTATCLDCGGRVLITSVGGSPLSGSHAWSGVCSECHQRASYRDAPGLRPATSFAPLWTAALPSIVRRQPARVLLRGEPVTFALSPEDGPPAEHTSLSFEQLIYLLRQDESS